MQAKVTIVGAGNVGATAAWCLAEREISHIVLLDVPQMEEMARGKALDIQQAGHARGYDSNVMGTANYADTEDSDVVVITAGLPRKPGMSREDLVQTNQRIITDVMQNVLPVNPHAIYVIVTNPLDTMLYQAVRISRLPRERIFGMAGVLDTARLATFIAMELHVDIKKVQGWVLGGHGDEMVPLVRYCTVEGVPIDKLISSQCIADIIERTRKGGGEILQLLGTSAFYAPGASIARMVEAILKDEKSPLPAAVYLQGEYGLHDICFGVPVILGRGGIEHIVEYELNAEERVMLDKSAALIRSSMQALSAC